MKEFGGSGTRKQACASRRCKFQVEGAVIPYDYDPTPRRPMKKSKGAKKTGKKGPATVICWDTRNLRRYDSLWTKDRILEGEDAPAIACLGVFLHQNPHYEVYDGQNMRMRYLCDDYESEAITESENEEEEAASQTGEQTGELKQENAPTAPTEERETQSDGDATVKNAPPSPVPYPADA